jgi:hypothetical protein
MSNATDEVTAAVALIRKGQTIGEAAAEANLNAASLVDAVMPGVALSFPSPVVAPTSFPTDPNTMPLTAAELRDHMIALYNTSESIRKYCRANGISSKRTTLSTAMRESKLAQRKQALFPFDKSILSLIDDYIKTYSCRKSVNAKMGRQDFRQHLVNMYTTNDSIRKYCKDHNLTSRRSTMTRAFAESGLAAKKEAKEPMDDSVSQLIEEYLSKMPSMKDKPIEATKKPPKIAMKSAKTSRSKTNSSVPPDEVQVEYIKSVLRTTPPGKVVEVMKHTSFEPAIRDMKDPDRWWMMNPTSSGGPPVPVSTNDLLKCTIKRPSVGLSDVPNVKGIPLAVEDMAKQTALSERQIQVNAAFMEANNKVREALMAKVTDQALKEKLEQVLEGADLLDSVKEQIQETLDGPFHTAVAVTHEGMTKMFDVKVDGLFTTVTNKEQSKKRKVDDDDDDDEQDMGDSKPPAKEQKVDSVEPTVAV